jgi:hypothetical protein
MIKVPIATNIDNSKVLVEFQENTLPQDTNALIQMLNKEKVGIEFWLEISVTIKVL